MITPGQHLILAAACISIPISIATTYNNILLGKRIDTLNDIVARQHNINPKLVHQLASKKLPYVSRTIKIVNVKFNDKGKATIYFNDKDIDNTLYSQTGCPSIAKHIGKSFIVDYNTVKANYAISCAKFKL